MDSCRDGQRRRCELDSLDLQLENPNFACSERLLWIGAAIGTVLVASFLWGTIKLVEWYTKEPIIKYNITLPTPPPEKQILENPSIKVFEIPHFYRMMLIF